MFLNSNRVESKSSITKLVYISVLVAISFVGSLIKIQGTIALDSMAGFFAALFLGPASGALVGSMGHLLTAFTSGFPLTLPMHLIIGLQMAVFIYIFGLAYKKTNPVLASTLAIILNGVVSVITLAPVTVWLGLPLNGKAFIYAMAIPLTLASGVNIILACIIYKIIKIRM